MSAAASSQRLHWYSLAFLDSMPNRAPRHANTYMGWPEQLVNKPRIHEAMRLAGVSQLAVLLSCSYLGHMTLSEMCGDEPLGRAETEIVP